MLVAAAAFILWPKSHRFDIEAAVAIAPTAANSATAALQATGYVTARRQATVSAQITGTLKEVLIEEGEHVKAGQVLARLDDTAQRATMDQAQAQYKVSQALLNQYRAQLDQGRRDLKRSQDLIAQHLVSAQALETAQTQVQTLAAQVDAQSRQVELGRAGIEAAKVQLDYTTVRAPFSGVVITKAAQAGEIVSPISAGGGFTRTGVGTIVDMDSLEIEVDVNEAYLNRVKPDQPAQAVLDAYPDWVIPAHVIAIIPTADRGKATVKVRVAFEQKDPRILPDMGVHVSFLESQPASAAGTPLPKGVLVPATAVVEREGKSSVFLIQGDRVRARAIVPGREYGDLRSIEGVDADTQVVKHPPAEMEDGDHIKLKG